MGIKPIRSSAGQKPRSWLISLAQPVRALLPGQAVSPQPGQPAGPVTRRLAAGLQD